MWQVGLLMWPRRNEPRGGFNSLAPYAKTVSPGAQKRKVSAFTPILGASEQASCKIFNQIKA